MDHDDVIYLLLFFFSVGVGHFVRQFHDKEIKKWLSTGIGFIVVFIASGRHILHPILFTLLNGIIILYTSKRNCHIVSFAFSFLYLFFYRTMEYFGFSYSQMPTDVILMVMTLKLINLALDVQNSLCSKNEPGTSDKHKIESTYVNPSFLDIFHYSFCYIGVLTGPFYSYRTYYDWLNAPFSTCASYKKETFHILKLFPFYGVLHLFSSHFWPVQYLESDEFYNERSVLYRLWYVNPSFFAHRLRILIVMVLSEGICTMAGLGAYPVATEPKPGAGPTTRHDLLNNIANNPQQAVDEVYNFETIHNFEPYGIEFTPTFRQTIKNWNICVQYWLAVNVYKRFPSKKFRTGATFAVSAAWHGVYTGYYVCLCSTPFYLPVEDLWVRLYRRDATGLKAVVLDFFIWLCHMEAYGIMGMAFVLLRVDKIFHFYASIYYIPHVCTLLMFIIGSLIAKNRKQSEESRQRLSETKAK